LIVAVFRVANGRAGAHIWNMAISALNSWRTTTVYIVSAMLLALFLYGCGRFYDGPISECASGYCSTHGQLHTAADYRAYKAWGTTIWIVWPIGIAALFFLQRSKPKGSK
jgi:hypothetical protein